jgi:hypothetical protein
MFRIRNIGTASNECHPRSFLLLQVLIIQEMTAASAMLRRCYAHCFPDRQLAIIRFGQLSTVPIV